MVKVASESIQAEAILARYQKAKRIRKIVQYSGLVLSLVCVVLVYFQKVTLLVGAFLVFAIAFATSGVYRIPPINFRAINQVLSDECNPYEFAKIYHTLLPLFTNPAEKNICYLNIAYGLSLQGNHKDMLSYINAVDSKYIDPPTKQLYFEILTRYFCALEDFDALERIAQDLEEFSTSIIDESVIAGSRRTLDDIKGFKALAARDFETCYALLKTRAAWLASKRERATNFMWVEYHFSHARVDERAENYTDLHQHCIYVIEHGNLLACVQEAAAMLKRAPVA